jgi:cytochrome c5
MKYSALAFLCCSAFLTSCDNSGDAGNSDISNSADTNLLDKASSMTNDAADAVKDISENVSGSVGGNIDSALDNAVETTKDITDNAMDSAKEGAAAVVDSAKEAVTDIADDTMKAVDDTSSAVVEKTDEVVAAVSSVTATEGNSNKEGETIFKASCNACHGSGVAGSPKLGDKADWDARIAQGKAVLVEHAIKGFRGKEGFYMPAKGGSPHLSDEQIAKVVEYMISKVQ